jgi:type I restriction enzyme S subunit
MGEWFLRDRFIVTAPFCQRQIRAVHPIMPPEKSVQKSEATSRFIEKCKVDRGTILIPCSGALGGILGRLSVATEMLAGKAVSQHAVRIQVFDPDFLPGYVAAFLGSRQVGYPLITALRHGKDVPEIEPDALAALPIPQLRRDQQQKIEDLMKGAYTCLDLANRKETQSSRTAASGL